MPTANPQLFAVEDQPEVFFSTAETSRAVNYAVRVGRARRIARGLNTRNVTDPLEVVARRNVWQIAAGYFPGAVVGDRTALDFVPAADGTVTLVADRLRDVRLPGVWLRARKGVGPVQGDVPWMGENLFMSSRARAFLENMRESRRGKGVPRTLSQAELEEKLDDYAARDQASLNNLRDEARALASELGAEAEFERLEQLIGALQGTRPGKLRSRRGRARQRELPYDQSRLARFEQLQHYLLSTAIPVLEESPGHELSTFAFFEAYFSNFIEGTEFELEEAERIVFEGVIPKQRPKDAHDILGTYHIVADPSERARTPAGASSLVDELGRQHAILLDARPDVGPGQFKTEPNRAGGTDFVAPELVEGTLREGWRLYETLSPGFARAAYAMFLVSEVHPFADGNGRIARILMNSELTAARQQRIIVPTASRDDYLSALRGMTHNGLTATYVTVLRALQQTSHDVDYSSRTAAELDLHRRRAFDDASRQAGLLGQMLDQATD